MDYAVHGDSYEHCDSKLEHGCGLLFQGNYPVAPKIYIYIYETHNAENSVPFAARYFIQEWQPNKKILHRTMLDV